MTQAQLIEAAVAQAVAALAAKQPAKAEKAEKRSKAEMLAAKDKAIRTTFTKRGITDVVLMDRSDRSKPYNVRPFGKKLPDGTLTHWLAEGKIVKKGEKAVKGLFHVSQVRDMTEEDLAKYAS